MESKDAARLADDGSSDNGNSIPPLNGHQQPQTTSADSTMNAEKGLGPVTEEKPPRNVTGVAWILVVLSILISTFLFALDNTIVADIQPAIVERFGAINKLPWLSAAFFLAAAGTNLFWGKMYAQFDAKMLYLVTVALFEAGSALCGGAPNMNALIVGRAICGFGGSGMYCGVLTLLAVNTTEHERPMYIGLTGVTWGLGTVLGPIIGGAFADSAATWRWSFYINLCVAGASLPIWLFIMPGYDPRPGVSLAKRYAEIDYFGTVLLVGAIVSGVMAVNFGGSVYAWNSGRIIGLFVTSGICFTLFALQQAFTLLTTKDRRIFPVQFLKSKIMIILFAETSAASTTTFLPIYFIPLFFQFVRNDSALEAGVRLLPLVCFLVFGCVANGAIMSATGYYFPWYIGGGILSVIGAALLYTVDESTTTAKIYGYSIIIGMGSGSIAQASFSVAQAKVHPKEIPLAIGFITSAQIAGATIALSISNSIFLNDATRNIARLLPNVPRGDIQGAIAGAGSAFLAKLDPASRASVTHAIVESMSKVYILGITAGALAAVLGLLMKKEKLFLKGGAAV